MMVSWTIWALYNKINKKTFNTRIQLKFMTKHGDGNIESRRLIISHLVWKYGRLREYAEMFVVSVGSGTIFPSCVEY